MQTKYEQSSSIHNRINTQRIRVPPTQIYDHEYVPLTMQSPHTTGLQCVSIHGNFNLRRPRTELRAANNRAEGKFSFN